jgi:dihydropyrimidinase
MIIIRNGIVNLNQEWCKVDLLIAEGKIALISHGFRKSPEMQEIDARKQYIIPGMIDMHVHVDDQIGACYLADTYRTGTEVAIRNGITSFYTFITQQDNETSSDAINTALRKTDNNLFCNVGFHITMKSLESIMDFYQNPPSVYRCKSIKLYTTYKNAGIYSSYDEIEEYFKYFDGKPVTILIHCEDEDTLEKAASLQLDSTNAFNHTKLRPANAEIKAIQTIIELAKGYDVKIHIVHVSTPEGIALIDKARSRMKITCETAPHYLFMNEKMLLPPDGHRWLCSPPLRSEQTRLTLHDLVDKGRIDVFATDHCAFSKKDKDANSNDFRNVPNGIAGIGALPHLIHQLHNQDAEKSLLFMSRHLSKNPAKIMDLFPYKGVITERADADICVVNPNGTEQSVVSSISDTYEPYPKVKSKLHFTHVILNGELVVKDGKLLDHDNPKGELLCLR